jgi:AcrR family transcriptional regulator
MIDGAAPRVGRPPAADGVATRRAIVHAASESMADIGYDAMRLDQIATTVGISRAAIYHYFPSKKHLARAVFLEADPDIDKYFEIFDVGADTLAGHLRALVKACMRGAFERQDPVLGFFQLGKLAGDDEVIAGVFRSRSAGVRRTARSLVEDALERGEIAADYATDVLAEAVLGVIWAMTLGAAYASPDSVRHQLELAADGLFVEPRWTESASDGSIRASGGSRKSTRGARSKSRVSVSLGPWRNG